jgi:hypothetical protein
MSQEAVVTAKAQETPQQKKMRLRKEFAKKNQKSVSIKVQEMEYADWNPTARMTLLVIALGARINEDAYVPEECPLQMPEILGWCDFAEWRIALRVGATEDGIQKIVQRFEDDGFLEIKRWTDSNNTPHNLYRVIEAKLDEVQRKEQKRGTDRPKRYKKSRKGMKNKGSFTTANQPGRTAEQRGVMEMDDDQ